MTNQAELNATPPAVKEHDLAEDQILAIENFIRQVGSIAKAQAALDALIELKRAA